MNKPCIIYNKKGDPVNGKYPPYKEIYGDEFGGYKSEAEKILFHDFAVLSSDFNIFYNNTFIALIRRRIQ